MAFSRFVYKRLRNLREKAKLGGGLPLAWRALPYFVQAARVPGDSNGRLVHFTFPRLPLASPSFGGRFRLKELNALPLLPSSPLSDSSLRRPLTLPDDNKRLPVALLAYIACAAPCLGVVLRPQV